MAENYTLRLPAIVMNGGLKITIQNESPSISFGLGYYQPSGTYTKTDEALSLSPEEGLVLYFNEANEIYKTNTLPKHENHLFTQELLAGLGSGYNNNSLTHEFAILNQNGEDKIITAVYDSNSSIWRLLILTDQGTWVEDSSALLTAAVSSVKHKIKIIDNNHFCCTYNDVVSIWNYTAGILTFVNNITLSFLNSKPINDIAIIDGFNKLAVITSTASEKEITFFQINLPGYTVTSGTNKIFTDIFINDFCELTAIDNNTLGVLISTDTVIKKSLYIINSTTNDQSSLNLNSYCESLIKIDNNHIITTDTTGNSLIYKIRSPLGLHIFELVDTVQFNNLNLGTTSHKISIINDPNSLYYKSGIIVNNEMNKRVYGYFSINLGDFSLSRPDTDIYEFSSDINIQAGNLESINNSFYITGVSSQNTPYPVYKIQDNSKVSKITNLEQVTIFNAAKGKLGDFNKVTAKEIDVDGDIFIEGSFIGDGSKLTGIPGGYDQSLNTTDNVTFNHITGTHYGDGSHLTGLPDGADQALNTTDDVVFNSVSANSYIGLPEGIKVYSVIAGEGTVNPTAIADRTYTLPEAGVGWLIGTAATLNSTGTYGPEMGVSSSDLLIIHPKGVPPFQVIMQRNKNKGFPAGQGITDFGLAYKANLANTAIRIDLFTEEEYEFWIQIVFL